MSSSTFIYCNAPDQVAAVADALKTAPQIVFDCEGRDLGETNGCMSLLGFGANGVSYLVDAVTIPKASLRPIFDILESSEHLKVVFDGRMDFSELFHGFGVHLKGVLDLQLADVASRAIRGEQRQKQLWRLSPYIPRWEVQANSAAYYEVHRLSGLIGCLKDNGIFASKGDALSHQFWMDRPLNRCLLEYAAQDLIMIEKLYRHFSNKGYINTKQLSERSQRYVELHIAGRRRREDAHALLPLNIINPITTGTFLECETCKRSLPLQSFAIPGTCWVCKAVKARS